MNAAPCGRTLRWLPLALLAATGLAAEAPAPSLSLSLRGVRDGTVEPGEPLAVAVRLAVPPRTTAAIELAPEGRAWTDAIRIEVSRESAGPALAQGAVVGRPESARLTLTATAAAGGVWLVPSAAMQSLAPGRYFVRAHLAVDGASGWIGRVESAPLSLTVVAPSAVPARVSQRVGARAFEAASAGRLEDAAGIPDAQLRLPPQDQPLLLLRAALSEQAGNPTAALFLVNRAARNVPPRALPPADLLAAQQRLQAALLGPPPTGQSPAWARVPPFLLPPADAAVAKATRSSSASTGAAAASRPPSSATTSPSVAAPAVAATPATGPRETELTAAPLDGKLVPAGELSDAIVRGDPAGQWAASGRAKSSYSNPNYGPGQATGAPDVPVGGDSIHAWCPGQQSVGTDWLEVTFARPTRATGVRVRQNLNPGAIVKVEAESVRGVRQVWWEGNDPRVQSAAAEIAWFAVRVPPTDEPVARIRLTLNLAVRPGWKQIDAIQLVAAP